MTRSSPSPVAWRGSFARVALLAFVVTAPVVRAQTPAAKFVDSARVEIDRAVLANDTARLGGAVILLDRALVAFPDDPYLLHYRGYAAYRQVIARYRANDAAGASPFIERAVADLGRSGEKLAWPETFELLAALDGFRIAVDPSRGQELGMEIGFLTGKASQLGPNNPRVLLVQAEGALRTPSEYGGGADVARALFAKAMAAFANDHPAPLAPAWGREEADSFKRQLDGGGSSKP
jgi:hypothetical protein